MINKQSKIKFYSLSDAFLKSISNKNEEFFNKFSKSYLYMIDHAIQNIANYNTVTITGFIVDSFTSIILLVVLVTLNP
jgi:ABC-type bacteriocin/lantibiotic exporter with double-glycine peptidase domain